MCIVKLSRASKPLKKYSSSQVLSYENNIALPFYKTRFLKIFFLLFRKIFNYFYKTIAYTLLCKLIRYKKITKNCGKQLVFRVFRLFGFSSYFFC